MNAVEPIVTAKGTVIKRYGPTGVGKRVGRYLYLHEDYALEAIAKIKAADSSIGCRLEWSLAEKVKEFPQFQFRCLRLDLKDGVIRFDEAPDFDTAREPQVGKWLLVCYDGHAERGRSPAIWHHKFCWVKGNDQSSGQEGYQGFDVAASRAWSAKYAPLLKEPPKGSQRAWLAQLAEVGLS